MSNTVTTLKKSLYKKAALDRYNCTHTLLGSILLSVGKLANIKEEELIQTYSKLQKRINTLVTTHGIDTVKGLVDYFVHKYEVEQCLADYLVCVYDEKHAYTPLVTIAAFSDDGGNSILLPLPSSGEYTGILLAIAQDPDNERYIVEDIYEPTTDDTINC